MKQNATAMLLKHTSGDKMAKNRGLFIVLEGIDGSGTTTQLNKLHDYVRTKSKYIDVLTTHEPWDSEEIKRILAEEKDAYSSKEEMTRLYVLDRSKHVEAIIERNLERGCHIVSDRYSMSTFAYQGTQGVDIETIRKLHERYRIPVPDLTLLLDINFETAQKRIDFRGEERSKFERNEKFTRNLIEAYRSLATKEKTLGKIIIINGKNSIEQVTRDISNAIDKEFKDYRWG